MVNGDGKIYLINRRRYNIIAVRIFRIPEQQTYCVLFESRVPPVAPVTTRPHLPDIFLCHFGFMSTAISSPVSNISEGKRKNRNTENEYDGKKYRNLIDVK